MPIQIRKVVRPLMLREFAKEYGEDYISVWVNPSREALTRYETARKLVEELKERISSLAENKNPSKADIQELGEELTRTNELLFAWYAEIWSQGLDATHHADAAAVKKLVDDCDREDPALWLFLIQGTWRLINEHLAGAKKG